MAKFQKAYGLTGGIASGKSTVSGFFRALGVAVISADEISREICRKGEEGWKKLQKAFGKEVFTPEGEFDRQKMADIVFSSHADSLKKRKLLEKITHPLIMRRIRQKIKSCVEQGEGLIIIEAALLMESGHDKEFEGTIVVTCEPAQQIERLCLRDGISKQKALQRIQSQWPLEKKVKRATFIIDNSRGIAYTRDQAREIFEKIKALKKGK